MQKLENKARIVGSFFITAGIMVMLLMILRVDLNLSTFVNILLTNLVMGGSLLFVTLGMVFLLLLIGNLRNQKSIFEGKETKFGALEISMIIFIILYILGFILSGHLSQVCEGDGCLFALNYLFFLVPPFGISVIVVLVLLLIFFSKTILKKDKTIIILNIITPLYFLGEIGRMISVLLLAPYPFENFNSLPSEQIIAYAIIYIIVPVFTIIFGIGMIKLANCLSKLDT